MGNGSAVAELVWGLRIGWCCAARGFYLPQGASDDRRRRFGGSRARHDATPAGRRPPRRGRARKSDSYRLNFSRKNIWLAAGRRTSWCEPAKVGGAVTGAQSEASGLEACCNTKPASDTGQETRTVSPMT